jgi:hypothetical protein
MTLPVYNDANFRLQFPQFADATAFPEVMLSGYWTMASVYINPNGGPGWCKNPAQLQLAIDLMAAHLAASYALINSGQPTVLVQGSSEGTVSVSLTPPPVTSAYGWWLATTPYGAQLRALLAIVQNVGFYFGGLPERSSFRKVAGIF